MKSYCMCKCKKGFSDFSINRSSLDGLNSRCWACLSEKRREKMRLSLKRETEEKEACFTIHFD